MKKLWAPWRLQYIQSTDEESCIFCLDDAACDDESRLILARGDHAFVMMNRYPYSSGHLMASPYRHIDDPAELNPSEVRELHVLMVACQRALRECCAAEGFNVGWNIGAAAGAGIADHIHMHIVPRWAGDTNFMPVLADMRVVPQHLETTYACLLPAFADWRATS